jgi:hypothetical protein
MLNTPPTVSPNTSSKSAEMLERLETGAAQRTAAQILSGNVPYQFMESILNSVIVNQPKETLTLVVSLIVELRKIQETQKINFEEALKYLEEMIRPLSVKLWEAEITIAEYDRLKAEYDGAPNDQLKGEIITLLKGLGYGEETYEYKYRAEWDKPVAKYEREISHLETSFEIVKNDPKFGGVLTDIVAKQTARLDKIKEMLDSDVRDVLRMNDLTKPEIELIKRLLTRKLASASPEELQRLAKETVDPELKAFVQSLAEAAKPRQEMLKPQQEQPEKPVLVTA